jgi:hypothetical protein
MLENKTVRLEFFWGQLLYLWDKTYNKIENYDSILRMAQAMT